MKPPNYNGEDDFDKAECWIETIEEKFELMDCTENKKMVFAVDTLREDAKDWWKVTKATEFPSGGIVAWEDFRRLFEEHFFFAYKRDLKQREYLDLRQEIMTVSQYLTKFIRLGNNDKMSMDELSKVDRFIQGLNPALRTKTLSGNYQTLNHAVHLATLMERDHQEWLKEKRTQLDMGQGSQQQQNCKGDHFQQRREQRRDNRPRSYPAP